MNEDLLQLYNLCSSLRPKCFAGLTDVQREEVVLRVQSRLIERPPAPPEKPKAYIYRALEREAFTQARNTARRSAILEATASQGVGSSGTVASLAPDLADAYFRRLFDQLLDAALELRSERYREGLRVAAEELWSLVREDQTMNELIAAHTQPGETSTVVRNRLLTRHKRVRQAMAAALSEMARLEPPPRELGELRRLHDRLLRCQKSRTQESDKP